MHAPPAFAQENEQREPATGIVSLQDLTNSEMANMVTAEDIAFLDTGFYTTLENLDDLDFPTEQNEFDYIHENGGALVIDIQTGLFQNDREDVLDLPNRWQGPYIAAYHPTRISEDGAGYDPGTPLDFWGTPYLLFSPLGLLRPQSEAVTLEYYGDSFDRYAIVSLGPDRVKSTDDVIRFFGVPPTSTVISSVSLSNNPTSGSLMQIRGYKFGDPPPAQAGGETSGATTSMVQINGDDKSGLVVSWTPTEILIDLSTGEIAQVGAVQIVASNGGVSQPYSYTLPPFLRAYNWEMYK